MIRIGYKNTHSVTVMNTFVNVKHISKCYTCDNKFCQINTLSYMGYDLKEEH